MHTAHAAERVGCSTISNRTASTRRHRPLEGDGYSCPNRHARAFDRTGRAAYLKDTPDSANVCHIRLLCTANIHGKTHVAHGPARISRPWRTRVIPAARYGERASDRQTDGIACERAGYLMFAGITGSLAALPSIPPA